MVGVETNRLSPFETGQITLPFQKVRFAQSVVGFSGALIDLEDASVRVNGVIGPRLQPIRFSEGQKSLLEQGNVLGRVRGPDQKLIRFEKALPSHKDFREVDLMYRFAADLNGACKVPDRIVKSTDISRRESKILVEIQPFYPRFRAAESSSMAES
jgi:hypothetical protein